MDLGNLVYITVNYLRNLPILRENGGYGEEKTGKSPAGRRDYLKCVDN